MQADFRKIKNAVCNKTNAYIEIMPESGFLDVFGLIIIIWFIRINQNLCYFISKLSVFKS